LDLQILVSTMHQNNHSLLEKMNIQSDAIIVNQCDRNEIEEFEYKGRKINFMSFAERGVGLSRNTALMRATADICLFADEDVIYIDGYKEIVLKAFEENSDADVIIFNMLSTNPERPLHVLPKKIRIRWYNCLRYGAVTIGIKTESIRKAHIYFSLLFGGGTRYSCGEDSLFLMDCIRKKLRIYGYPVVIGHVSQENSSWFHGYTEKHFVDRGALYACLSKHWAVLLCLQFCVRHRKLFKNEKTWYEAFALMIRGLHEFKKGKR
jgi:glycosyltransferase involved in cell wall biosynthesis